MLELQGGAARGRPLFLVVLGFLLFQTWFLIADRRLPLGHETLTRYTLQYTFMNGAAQDGTIPLWLPYAAQGTTSAWAWFEQGTFLQNALLLAAPLCRGAGFLPFFHLGMLLEELLLLVGVWLLASRYFRSPYTVFFVSVAALGSSLWMDHAAQNLLSYSALPLALHLLHEQAEGRSPRKLVLLGILLVVQALGKPPACALIVPASAALYWAGLAVFARRPKPIAWSRGDLMRAAGPAILLLLCIGVGAFAGTGDLVPAHAEGPWTLNALLAGAGLENPLQYLDAGLCFSPNLDATCFVGYLTLGFALLALARLGRRSALLLLGLVLGGLLILSALTLAWAALLPMPFPDRAPTQGVPLLRLFIIFLAGFGFQGMLEARAEGTRAASQTATALIVLAVLQGILYAGAMQHPEWTDQSLRLLTLRSPQTVVLPILGTKLFVEQAGMAALMSGLAAGVLLLWSSGPRYAPMALALALLIHPLDLFDWKFRMDWLKTSSLSPDDAALQKLSGLPYSRRRAPDRNSLERFRRFQVRPPLLAGLDVSTYGADSWLRDSFWYADLPASPAPELYGSSSVDALRRALPACPASPELCPPSPWTSETARKLAGLSRDKLRFFSRSHPASSATIASALSRREFAGDLLFVEGPPEEPPPTERDEHLDLAYEVIRFSPNSLTVIVDTAPAGAWMSYADAWHPSWTAEINGQPAPVLRADLAYKAVRLAEGRNVVELSFRSPLRSGTALALGVLSAAGLALLLRELCLVALGRSR